MAGTSYWPGPAEQPDNYLNEGQKCSYYVSSVWPGGEGEETNTNLAPLGIHGVVGDEVCTHPFRGLCELPADSAEQTTMTGDKQPVWTWRQDWTGKRNGQK